MLCLAVGFLAVVPAFAAPPDLTAPGVIAGIDRSATYNLGPTGLRGWIYITTGASELHGSNGTMTGESRQILVTVASTPASAVLAVDDVILGAMAASSGNVPLFTSDARKAFGAAITEAEKPGGGTLRVRRWRAGAISDENISITIIGDYTATAPYSCPKSSLVLTNARNKLVGQLKADANFLSNDWKGAISGLALLAGVQSGDPDYTTVQTRLQTFARARANAGPQAVGLPIWDWAYSGLFLAEYYLATGDANVLPGINSYTIKLSQSQSINGTFGHGASVVRPDGSGRRMGIGYGPVNAVGIVANMAIVLGKKALLAGAQPIDPEINGAIQRGSDYFAFYVNKGPIPYGEHEPYINGHSSNGKDPMCAVFFGLQSGRAAETEYYSRMSIAGYNGREYGHTGQGFSYLWGALGANMGGALAVAEHLKPVRWHLDLSRRTDGSFAYDGAEQYGAGSTGDGTYLGDSGYYGINTTASYILTYALPLQRLYITGKRDIPANPPALALDAPTVAHAVSAATFKIDCIGFTIAQLMTSLSDYDPVVRHYAAVELAKRTLTSGDLTTLRNMVTGPSANGRMGACQVLGILRDSTALPTIVQRLNKTTETDLWVRAKAASAIRGYTALTASTHRDTMLTEFVANATDPDNIIWSDPIQMSNNFLSFALFGDSVSGGNHIGAYTVSAPKNLLYPAVQVGLKQPDSLPRAGATKFCFDRLPLADVQALIPDFFQVVEIECLADRMWAADSQSRGISTLSKYKISEGIPYALAMLDIPEGFEWGSNTTLIAALNALASYGDAARWTLPTLRSYLGKWNPDSSQYTTLVNTINSIQNAITAPAQAPGLAVANSQVIPITGPVAITLTGSSPRSSVTFTNVTAPAHGTLTGTAPNLTYTPNVGYTGPDFFTFQVVDSLGASYPSAPGTVSILVGTAGTGLKGEYYDNINFTNPVLTRTDPQVNFDWVAGSPHASIGADTFSVRWSGLLLVPESGNYTFSSLSSDGIRLYVNGTLVIDNFTDQSTRWTDGSPIYLSQGQMADIYIEYYENTGSAVAKLKWTGPSFAGMNGATIPQAYLFDGSTITNRLAFAFPQNLTTNRNTALPITLNGSGGSLTYTLLTQPANGTLTGIAPNLTYTPNSNFTGTDSFTFLVNNGSINSLPATITLSVQAGALTPFTWATATSGNWSDVAKWTPGAPAIAGQANYALNFTPAGTYTATHNLNSGFQLNQLNTASTVTLDGTQSLSFVANGGSQPGFNQNGANMVTVDTPVHLAAMTNFGGSGSGEVVLTKQITGNGGILKTGFGKLRIYGVNSNNFSGGTTINSGTLVLGAYIPEIGSIDSINPLGTGPVTLNGVTIELQRVTASHPLTVNGGTLFSDNGWGATWSGPVTLNQPLTTRCNWPLILSGSISGPSGIIKTGTDTLTLSVANSYTGTTEIREGRITCSNASALGSGPLIITSPAVATLNFTGTRSIASLTLGGTLMPPGTYGSSTSTATFKNNTYFSGNGTVTVLQSTATALSLTNGSSPAAPGSSLTFTATVTGANPTGNVQFFSGNTLLGTSALNGSFQATFTTSQLAIGPHSITARYIGNSTNGSSNSSAIAVEIEPVAPAVPTNLTATPAAPNINLAWTASAGATGYYVKRSLSSGGPYTVIAPVTGTTYQDSAITAGVSYHYVISAINSAGEGGDSNQSTAFITSPTTTTLTSSAVGPESYGTSVTFTATITASTGTPGGTVTFRSGANIIGTRTLSSGVASLTMSTLAVATHSITARYEGAGPHDASNSAALTYQVTAKPVHITGTKIYDATTTANNSILTISNNLDGGNLSLVGIANLSAKDVGTRTILSGSATITRVQTTTGGTTANNSNSTSITATLPSSPTNGNTLIAVISTRNTTVNQVTGITGGGVTWTRVSQAANANGSTTEIWYGPDVSSGGATITISHAGNRSSAVVMEYSGLLVPTSFDVAANTTGNGTAASTGTTANTNQPNQLWIGGIAATSGSPTISSLTNSFINAGEASSSGGSAGNNTKVFALERIVTTTGTAATGGTLSASAQWSGAIATFRATSSSSLSLSGSAAANYTLVGMTSAVTITPKSLTVSGLSANNRTYNGTTSASLTGTPSLLAAQAAGAGNASDGKPYTGDVITLGGTASGSFATKHIGTAKPVIVSGLSLSGSQAANYTLTSPAGLTANITPLAVTVSAVNATKTFDGTTTASGVPTIAPSLAPGDTTTVLSQAYQTATAGEGSKVIIPSITINDGNSGANYAVTLVSFTTGTIQKAAATVTLGNLAHVFSGAPKSASVTTDPVGLATSITYDGSSTAPSSAGTYLVVATVTDPNHSGSASGNLVITAQDPFDSWASGQTTFTGDSNNDGLADGIAWLLGAEMPSANANTLLPVPTAADNILSVQFQCLQPAQRGSATLELQYSANLAPASWIAVAIPTSNGVVDGVSFTITPVPDSILEQVEAAIPSSLGGTTGRIFMRLCATPSAP